MICKSRLQNKCYSVVYLLSAICTNLVEWEAMAPVVLRASAAALISSSRVSFWVAETVVDLAAAGLGVGAFAASSVEVPLMKNRWYFNEFVARREHSHTIGRSSIVGGSRGGIGGRLCRVLLVVLLGFLDVIGSSGGS